MSKQTTRQILCAVRGGPESRATVSQAIDLALSRNARLTFFHVLDAEFLNHATIGPLSVVYRELAEMGKFAMLIVCDRAKRRGVVEVDYIVREGSIRKQLRQIAVETRAELLVLGRPIRSPGSNVFKIAEVDAFTSELAAAGGLEVVLATA